MCASITSITSGICSAVTIGLPVAIGLAAGGGLATPVAWEVGGVVDVFDPVAYAASLLVTSRRARWPCRFPPARAARIDPIATLRNY